MSVFTLPGTAAFYVSRPGPCSLNEHMEWCWYGFSGFKLHVISILVLRSVYISYYLYVVYSFNPAITPSFASTSSKGSPRVRQSHASHGLSRFIWLRLRSSRKWNMFEHPPHTRHLLDLPLMFSSLVLFISFLMCFPDVLYTCSISCKYDPTQQHHVLPIF